MVTGKLFQLDLLQEKSYVLSLQWQWSEMPSIFDHQARCTFRCKRTYTQFAVQLHSCVPMRQRTRRKASHLFTSLPNSINLVPTRAARTRCVQDLHAWISHLSHEQVHDSASVSVDFCQAQVEKEKKKYQVASPGGGWKQFIFPTKQGEERKKHFWDLGPSWGSTVNTVSLVFLN